jgi:hypothetical protein
MEVSFQLDILTPFTPEDTATSTYSVEGWKSSRSKLRRNKGNRVTVCTLILASE